MKILAIDYGEKKTGVAYAEGPLADPVEVIYHENDEVAIFKLLREIDRFTPELLLIGMPSGSQGEIVKNFIQKLKEKTKLPIKPVDERLSTLEAQYLSKEAGHNRKKRRRMEDAYSASIILQKYLDSMV